MHLIYHNEIKLLFLRDILKDTIGIIEHLS